MKRSFRAIESMLLASVAVVFLSADPKILQAYEDKERTGQPVSETHFYPCPRRTKLGRKQVDNTTLAITAPVYPAQAWDEILIYIMSCVPLGGLWLGVSPSFRRPGSWTRNRLLEGGKAADRVSKGNIATSEIFNTADF